MGVNKEVSELSPQGLTSLRVVEEEVCGWDSAHRPR